MTRREFASFIAACMLLFAAPLHAQVQSTSTTNDSSMYRVSTREGLRVEGMLMGWSNDTLLLRTRDNVQLRIPAASMIALTPLGAGGETPQTKDRNAAWRNETPEPEEAPEDTRRYSRPSSSLFIFPTAYAEPAGQVRLGVYELFFPTASFGIADIATLQVGTLFFPTALFEFGHSTLKITPLSNDRAALAVGATVLSWEKETRFYPFAVGTVNLGGENGLFVTAGLANDTETGDVFYNAGLEIPTGTKTRLIFEATMPEKDLVLVNAGLRIRSGNFDFDLGFGFVNEWELFPIPWVGASVIL